MLSFSAVLALIIGIGTGAVTTPFGAMNASVLRPLGLGPSRLVAIQNA